MRQQTYVRAIRRVPGRGLGLACLLAIQPAMAAEPSMSATGAALATGSGLLETELVAEIFVPASDATGPARWRTAERLASGDEVHYTLRVHNPGTEPVRDVIVTKLMPFGMHYMPGSATGPSSSVDFSTDGGQTFDARPDAGDVSHLRWSLRKPLPAGATALLRFRATFR